MRHIPELYDARRVALCRKEYIGDGGSARGFGVVWTGGIEPKIRLSKDVRWSE